MGNSVFTAIAEREPTRNSFFIRFHKAEREESLGPELTLIESTFQSMLVLERRRAQRSRKPFVLMLMDASQENGLAASILRQTIQVVSVSKRETDIVGWYKQSAIIGVIFTEVSLETEIPITEILRAKIRNALVKELGDNRATKVAISVHLFPENLSQDKQDKNDKGSVADSKLYPDARPTDSITRVALAAKRAIDVLGSMALLLVLSPVLAVIAALVKLTSQGPVIFRQVRLGQRGVHFHCLKFRTMHVHNDPKIHQEFVQQFIAGKAQSVTSDKTQPVYKLVNDPRVTAVGRFLRKTSLDELPQFWNVLRGEMSLVGPRPPVPYEYVAYDVWHRRRVLEVKPGVTGLWQVSGRSRTRFDEMVRLDLRYCQTWSVLLDLKILMATPRAVFHGDGAC